MGRDPCWNTVTAEGNLAFDTAPDPLPFFEASMPRALRQAPLGSIYEWRADNIALELGRRTREEGAALIIDYGHAHSGMGELFKAIAIAAPKLGPLPGFETAP